MSLLRGEGEVVVLSTNIFVSLISSRIDRKDRVFLSQGEGSRAATLLDSRLRFTIGLVEYKGALLLASEGNIGSLL